MEMLENLFEQALNIQLPWKVTSIDFKKVEKVIDIHIDFTRGSIFKCSKCGNNSKAYDTTEKKWRHLNFFEYESYIIARVPRTDCNECGVLQIEIPWARSGADFTYLFDSLMMILCREMPVNKVSQIVKEDDNKLWRLMHHYTEEARKLEDYSNVKAIGVDETSKKKGMIMLHYLWI
ncbi:helix-turn-helix domain-containing protein [Candidatus Magnetobacterium casense]|uniref:helix-turn-helix domain-containing protein n=6 Tax=Candidatus Magnetobacterium casense TaxID=1455061 RepID=UPI00190F7BEC|nr:transposase family protein [Candidatus Magnetobacterium casensis]